jgi:hypothetical protein
MTIQSYVQSRRVYLPLVDGASPPLLKFTNGVEVVELPRTHFVMFTKTLESQYGDLTLNVHSRFHTPGWARLLGWEGLAPTQVQQVVDGILEAIRVKETRFVNPVRLLENGLSSSEPYIQVLIWVMALDGLLMSNTPLILSSDSVAC